mgnify:CR=1 FL=1
MKQNIPYSYGGLLSSSATAINGVNKHVAHITPAYNTAAVLTTLRTAAVNARDAMDAGILQLRELHLQREAKGAEGRAFMMLFRDLLRPTRGYRYSQAWAGTGFVNQLRIPQPLDQIETLVESAAGFLTAYPEEESAGENVTAEHAGELHTSLHTLRQAVIGKRTELRTLSAAKAAAFKALRGGLIGLKKELHQLLSAHDERWLDYGFNIPGVRQRPETPQDLEVVLVGPTALSAKWKAAPRAEYYRVWRRVAGQDPDFIVAGSPADLDFLMEALPANSTVEIAVSAINSGGESPLSPVVSVQTL